MAEVAEVTKFYITGVDPGITAMGLVLLDASTMRLVDARPVNILTFVPEDERKKISPTLKTPPAPHILMSYLQVPDAVIKMVRSDKLKGFFSLSRGVRAVMIEKQMVPVIAKGERPIQSPLVHIQTNLQTAMCGRGQCSDMKSVRVWNDTTQSASSTTRFSQRAAYTKRKNASVKCAPAFFSAEDLMMLRQRAEQHWHAVANASPLDSVYRKKEILRDKIKKCHEDLIEAAFHARYPGNWAGIEQRIPVSEWPLKMRTEYEAYTNAMLERRRKKQRDAAAARKARVIPSK